MSVWMHPKIRNLTAHIERQPYFQSEERSVVWEGLAKEQYRLLLQKSAQSQLLFHSSDARKDPEQIGKLHDLEVMAEFMSALYGLTHKDTKVRGYAEQRVQRVIGGQLAIFDGLTMSSQFARALQNSQIKARPGARVEVSHDMN